MSDTSHYYGNAYAAAPTRYSTMEEMNLIYPNSHVDVRALTTSLKQLAQQYGITSVGVTETLQPVGATFQDWQTAQLTALEAALASAA